MNTLIKTKKKRLKINFKIKMIDFKHNIFPKEIKKIKYFFFNF